MINVAETEQSMKNQQVVFIRHMKASHGGATLRVAVIHSTPNNIDTAVIRR